MTINQNWNMGTIYNTNNLNRHEDVFQKVRNEKLTNVTFIDDGTLRHILDTSEFAQKHPDVKVIIGCKIPFKIGLSVVKLALYPKDNKGLHYLYQLSTEFQEGGKTELRLEGRKKALSRMNVVVDASEGMDDKDVLGALRALYNITSKGYIHVGVSETLSQQNKEKNLKIKSVLEQEGIGYLPFNQVLFLDDEDYEDLCDLLKFKDVDVPEDIDNIFMNNDELEEIFDYMSGVENNSQKIIKNTHLNVVIEEQALKVPTFKVEEKFEFPSLFKTRFDEYIQKTSVGKVNSAAYLFHLTIQGVLAKYGKDRKAFERALYELKVIIESDFSDYFLIVWDMIRYAKSSGITIGPGRGSSVGSIVAYALNITEIDPLKWNLQFERFLNIHRSGFPDIDIDVSQRNREKLIRYIKNKYREEYVSQIVTRSNYGFKSVINYMVKHMRVPSEKVKSLRELRPENFETQSSFLESLDDKGKELFAGSKDLRVLLDRGFSLRDVPQSTSRHASGVIISSERLRDLMPMMFDEHGMITQVPNDNDKNSLEKLGHLKYDVLGLKKLDEIEDTFRKIEKKIGRKLPEIPMNDAKTLKTLNDGFMEGVFQLESAGRFAKIIGIDDFNDIIALVALNRPGPMDNIPLYADRKGKEVKVFGRNKKELEGVESLYPILEETYGVIVYQEQINEIVREWAGYTLGEADLFRAAISKKNVDVLKKQRYEFIKKSNEKGRDKEATVQLYDLIFEFANYGFNKSHAVSYAWIAYVSAYLKSHFPNEYLSTLMDYVVNSGGDVSAYIGEARRLGISVLRPDINLSDNHFRVTDEGIRSAIQMVSGIGKRTAKAVVRVRGNQAFKNISDVVERIQKTDVSKSNIETLVRAGALDSIGERLFMLRSLTKDYKLELPLSDRIKEELRLCGVIFSIDTDISQKLVAKAKESKDGITGILTKVTETQDKYKRDMAKVQLLDFDGKTHYLVIFYRLWKEVKSDITEGALVIGSEENRASTKVKTFNL